MGGSGCGKSTLLRHMSGAIGRMPARSFRRAGPDHHDRGREGEDQTAFGMSFQSAALIDYMTVAENVSLPLREHTRLDPRIIGIIVKMKLSLVGMQGSEDLMPSMLSGGMKKRVGLARAIAMDPEVVFYDEPTAGLDPGGLRGGG